MMSPDPVDYSPFVEVAGLKLRADALKRLRAEWPGLDDEEVVAQVMKARSLPRSSHRPRAEKTDA